MNNYLRALTSQQLGSLEDHIRIVVIHPNYRDSNVTMSEFLSDDVLYVRFTGKKLNLSALKSQLQSEAEDQNVAQDMKMIKHIILDECDRATPKAVDSFLKHLLKQAPNARLVVFSRRIPQGTIHDATLREQTSFVPHDTSFMLWDYSQHTEDTKLLEVQALGKGHVYLNGKPVEDWDGVLPRSLFFYLVDRGMTTRSEIFQTFWPTLTKREATNVFHVTKRKISEVLGMDLTTYWSGYYRIAPEIELNYDTALFTEVVRNSMMSDDVDTAASYLRQATALYRGHFLSTIDMTWSNQRRTELANEFGDAMAHLAQAKAEKGDKDEALGLYLRAAAFNRHRDDLSRSIMHLYRDINCHQDALVVYENFRTELNHELGIHPSDDLRQLASTIQQEMQTVK